MLDDGVIGDLHMLLLRAVIPYHVYFPTWHRRREWSGGALNDKSSHHMDVFNWFAGGRAARISAFGGCRVFRPDPASPERCSVCERDCPYRMPPRDAAPTPDHVARFGSSWLEEKGILHRHDTCVYRPGADIRDHATIQIAYENGVVAALFWCIFGPRAEDQETLEIVGSRGRLILTRHTGRIDLVAEYGHRHDVLDTAGAEASSSHFGADLELVREMRRFADGAPPAVSGRDALAATRMVMAAQRSIDERGRTVALDEMPDTE